MTTELWGTLGQCSPLQDLALAKDWLQEMMATEGRRDLDIQDCICEITEL